MSDKRRMPRTRKRLSCSLMVNSQRYTGIVLDISATGLFIQTSVAPKPGTIVNFEMRLPSGESLSLQASVARRRNVPAHMQSIARGGIGLCLESTPEEYFALVEAIQGPREVVASAPEPARLKETPHSDLARKALFARLDKIRSEDS